MKVAKNEKTINTVYPVLKKLVKGDDLLDPGAVVLFIAPGNGVVVAESEAPGHEYSIGYFSNHWAESDGFMLYEGEVTLSN